MWTVWSVLTDRHQRWRRWLVENSCRGSCLGMPHGIYCPVCYPCQGSFVALWKRSIIINHTGMDNKIHSTHSAIWTHNWKMYCIIHDLHTFTKSLPDAIILISLYWRNIISLPNWHYTVNHQGWSWVTPTYFGFVLFIVVILLITILSFISTKEICLL
jgi:hypothetical protein